MATKKLKVAPNQLTNLCKSMIEFERHGVTIYKYACMLEEMGFLISKDHIIPPLAKTFKLYLLTQHGRKNTKYAQELWEKYFMVAHGQDNHIPDPYNADDADEYQWVLSYDRLMKEKQANRMSQVLKRLR